MYIEDSLFTWFACVFVFYIISFFWGGGVFVSLCVCFSFVDKCDNNIYNTYMYDV